MTISNEPGASAGGGAGAGAADVEVAAGVGGADGVGAAAVGAAAVGEAEAGAEAAGAEAGVRTSGTGGGTDEGAGWRSAGVDVEFELAGSLLMNPRMPNHEAAAATITTAAMTRGRLFRRGVSISAACSYATGRSPRSRQTTEGAGGAASEGASGAATAAT
jgi:hypothetical protein